MQNFSMSQTIPAVPVLTFAQTADVLARMESLARTRVGGMDLVAGRVDGSDVALCIDSMVGGGSVVVTWSTAPDRD